MGKRIREFKMSSHAKRRMAERGVDEEDMKEAILRPDRQREQFRGTHGGIVWRFTKEKDGKRLAVVAELYKETCFPVTAFYEEDFRSDSRPGKDGAGR